MLKNFRTYQLAIQLYHRCEQLRIRGPLRDQLRRASSSVVLNVAEGSAKPTAKERRRFYSISLASLREIQAILELARCSVVAELADHVGACLYKLSRTPAP